jgi:hypothetical protein
MTQNEILHLAFVAFFVLLILSIVFASKNKKLMNQVKENTKKQKLVAKHYPTYDFALRYGSVVPIAFGTQLALQAYGWTGGFVVLGLILFLSPLLHMASLFLQEQARLREAEGDEGFKAKVKLIKKHNSVDYNAFIIVACFGGSFLGIYLHDFGILQAITFGSLTFLLFVPLEHWIHLKLLKKSKLREQKQNE